MTSTVAAGHRIFYRIQIYLYWSSWRPITPNISAHDEILKHYSLFQFWYRCGQQWEHIEAHAFWARQVVRIHALYMYWRLSSQLLKMFDVANSIVGRGDMPEAAASAILNEPIGLSQLITPQWNKVAIASWTTSKWGLASSALLPLGAPHGPETEEWVFIYRK